MCCVSGNRHEICGGGITFKFREGSLLLVRQFREGSLLLVRQFRVTDGEVCFLSYLSHSDSDFYHDCNYTNRWSYYKLSLSSHVFLLFRKTSFIRSWHRKIYSDGSNCSQGTHRWIIEGLSRPSILGRKPIDQSTGLIYRLDQDPPWHFLLAVCWFPSKVKRGVTLPALFSRNLWASSHFRRFS